MTVWFAQWTLDVRDVPRMAEFWSAALGYEEIRHGEDGSAKLYPPAGSPKELPPLWLQNTGGPKQGKNRFHPDLRPAGQIGPVHARVRVQRPVWAGRSRHGDRTQLYASRGSGFGGPPMRVFAPSEITLLTLRAS